MPKRFCLGCPAVFDRAETGTGLCPACQAAADQRAAQRRARSAAGRPSSSARGYGSVYRKRRALVVERALANGEACSICGEPCLPGQRVVAHHPDGKPALADEATCRLLPAHKPCNDGFRPGRSA